MKKLIDSLINGRNNLVNGVIAMLIVASIALGCNCTKGMDFGNTSSSSNSSNSGKNDTPFSSSSDDDDADGVPGDDLLNALVAETTADFAYSISEGDFQKMYDKASTDFQSTYTKDQMQDFFKDFIAKKRQILPILNKANDMKPEYSPKASIRTEQGLDILVVNGKYATKPVPVTFNYEYVKRGGSWKMLVLKVYLR